MPENRSSKLNFRLRVILLTLLLNAVLALPGRAQMIQYLFDDFTESRIKMSAGQYVDAVINYNTLTGCMVYLKGKQYFDLTNYRDVDTVYVAGRIFIPVDDHFNELIYTGPVPLSVQYIGKLKGNPGAYGTTSQTTSSNYITSIEKKEGTFNLELPPEYVIDKSTLYWVKTDDEWKSFNSVKQFTAIFPDRSEQLKTFFKDEKLSVKKKEDIIKALEFLQKAN